MKRDLPKYVCDIKGVLYFRRRGWKTVRFASEPLTPEFWTEYALILRGSTVPPKDATFKALIASYKRSGRFTSKAARTRQDYDKVLSFIEERLGDKNPRDVRPHHVHRWSRQRGGRAGEYLIQILNVLYKHGREIGMTDDNPARDIRPPERERREREPWPPELVKAAREVATGDDLLLLELLIGTGQRIGDVLKFRWSQFGEEGIDLCQGKTKWVGLIPYTDRLRAVLATTPRNGIMVLLSKRGTPLSYRAAAQRMRKIRDEIGAGPEHDLHALRYTAAHELAEAGCSDEEIEAVTGHKSRAMVAKYAGAARQKTRAREAQGRRK